MQKRVERNHSTDAEEVLHLVRLGFYHRQLSAEHCIVTDKGLGPDGSHRFGGPAPGRKRSRGPAGLASMARHGEQAADGPSSSINAVAGQP